MRRRSGRTVGRTNRSSVRDAHTHIIRAHLKTMATFQGLSGKKKKIPRRMEILQHLKVDSNFTGGYYQANVLRLLSENLLCHLLSISTFGGILRMKSRQKAWNNNGTCTAFLWCVTIVHVRISSLFQ